MKLPVCFPKISISFVSLVSLTIMNASCDAYKNSDWRELTGDEGLKGWRIADPNGKGIADWISCTSVELASENPLLLRTRKGKEDAVIVNGTTGKTENIVSTEEH